MKDENARNRYEVVAKSFLENNREQLGIATDAVIEFRGAPNDDDFDIEIRSPGDIEPNNFIGIEVTAIGDHHQEFRHRSVQKRGTSGLISRQRIGRLKLDPETGESVGEEYPDSPLNRELCRVAHKKWKKVLKSEKRNGHKKCWLLVSNSCIQFRGQPGVVEGPQYFWERIIVTDIDLYGPEHKPWSEATISRVKEQA